MASGLVNAGQNSPDRLPALELSDKVDERNEVLLDELIAGIEGFKLDSFLCGRLSLELVVLSQLQRHLLSWWLISLHLRLVGGTEIGRVQFLEFFLGGRHAVLNHQVAILPINHAILDDLVDAFIELLQLALQHQIDLFVHLLVSSRRQGLLYEHFVELLLLA